MMAEYAPAAIHWLASGIISGVPSAEMSGIVGDPSHDYGYHRARNTLPSDDYSVKTAPDKQGDGWAASALDIKMNSTQMKLVTKRLLASAKNPDDHRLDALREFFGTTDGSTVAGWDCYYGRSTSSDDTSHTWHIHMSILRKYSNDRAALAGILSVFIGDDDDMELTDQVTLGSWMKEQFPDLETGKRSVGTVLGSGYGHSRSANEGIYKRVIPMLETLVAAKTGATLVEVRATLDSAFAKASAEEKAQRAVEDAALVAKLQELAPDMAARIAPLLDSEMDVASIEAAVRNVFGTLDNE